MNLFSNSGEENDARSSSLNNIQKLNFSTVIILNKCLTDQSLPGKKKEEEKQCSDTGTVLKWKVQHSVSIIQKKK